MALSLSAFKRHKVTATPAEKNKKDFGDRFPISEEFAQGLPGEIEKYLLK